MLGGARLLAFDLGELKALVVDEWIAFSHTIGIHYSDLTKNI